MSDLWIPVIAALGASFLTGASAFGLEWWRLQRAGKAALAERRSRAYSALLTRSVGLMHLASNLHVIMQSRTITQNDIGTLDLIKLMDAESQPLYECWSEIWAVGTQEAITASNDLVNACADLINVATQRGKGMPLWIQAILGEKWTKDQIEQSEKQMQNVGEFRRRFGVIARKDTGMDVANLFASNDLKQLKSGESPQP